MEKSLIIVDTDILINHARSVSKKLIKYLNLQSKNKLQIGISVITIFEYYSGSYLLDSNIYETTELFFLNFRVFEITREIAKEAARINREYKLYKKIESTDLLIAATAIHLNASLLTTNKKHFKLIPGIKFAQ